jgi:hypothetical protein
MNGNELCGNKEGQKSPENHGVINIYKTISRNLPLEKDRSQEALEVEPGRE